MSVGSSDPHVLRATFDDVPALYDRARPRLPEHVLDDLVRLARLEPGARILEIGCGTGQATLPLARRGFEIVAVELGEHMAEHARANLAEFPGVRVVTSAFEDWDPGGELFDAVVSFNAFHWIDRDVRYSKSAELLREGGVLAVLGTRFVEHDGADPLWLELQEDYVAVTGAPEPRLHQDDVRDRRAEFEEEGLFRDTVLHRYRWETPYDGEAFVSLLATQSWYSTLEPGVRDELFARIRRRIDASPARKVAPTLSAVLYVATRTALPR